MGIKRLHESEPPRFSAWLLEVLAPSERREVLLGDFQEGFAEMVAYLGGARARRWYRIQVGRSIPALLFQSMYWGVVMLKNYLKVALRNMRRYKGYASINVIGLAIGLALCALIYLYVHNELTYDRFHERADRIFRITVEYLDDGSEMAWQPYPLAAALKADLPEVEETARFFDQSLVVRAGEQAFEETVVFTDPSVFGIFTFPLKQGNPATALSDPGSIVLSETAARKYFGEKDPMGRTMSLRMGEAYQDAVVTGIAYDAPGNSSIHFDYLVPFARLTEVYDWIRNRVDRWNASSFYVYALLSEQAVPADVQAKMPAFRAQYYPDELARAREEDGWEGDTSPTVFRLQPLTEIHLDPGVYGGLSTPSDPAYSYILAAIALAILGIACINFMTLAIGRSAGRAREIGVRKVVGAQRHQLMSQFWGEALLLSLLALGAGLLLAELLLPTFNTLADRELRFDYLDGGATLGALMVLVLAVGLMAGSYPAVVLSGLRPIEVLRRRLRLGGANVLTKALVVVQFALSIVLVVGTLVMLRQVDYLQARNVGFDREQVVVVPIGDVDGAVMLQRFRNALAGHDDIAGITGMSNAFTQGLSLEGWTYKGEDKRAYTYRVEGDFLEVMGIELVAGRTFDPGLATDSTGAVLVNEALVRDFGWADPLGERLDGFYSDPEVVGVFKDINFLSLRQEVMPLVLTLDPSWATNDMLVRLAAGDVPRALGTLQATWEGLVADVPFQYTFLDEDLGSQYESEVRWGRIVTYAAIMAIFVACLGLFGLAALAVAARSKEVGIRKVMGASASSLALLLSRDLVKLVVVALCLGAPAAFFAMRWWLEGFAYRIEMQPWIFVLAGLLALSVAWLAVGYQAVKAALANPVEVLRHE